MIKINILTHFLFALNTIGCINNVDGNHKLSFNGVKDSLQIPTGMSKNATLLNLGSDVEPILAWADYIGMLHKEGISYSHIHGVRYCYVLTFR